MLDRLVRIYGELEFFGELPDLCGGAFEIERDAAARLGGENDVLRDCHRLDQHEMLVDHADAECDRVVRGIDVLDLPIDEDLATVRGVEPVSDTHRRRLPGAILTDDGMDRPGLNDDVDVVVCAEVAEAFGYLSESE